MRIRPPFKMKEFEVFQNEAALPVTTDACLFGAWVQSQIQKTIPINNQSLSLLDIGTGTGLLSFIIAQKFPNFLITGIDNHAPSILNALDSLQNNRRNYNKFNNITFQNLDFLTPQSLPINSYNIIVSNPPFFQNQLESSNATRNVARHSNSLSPHKLITQSQLLIKENGSIFLLYPFSELETIFNELTRFFTVNQFVIIKPTEEKLPHVFFVQAAKCLPSKPQKLEDIPTQHLTVYQQQNILSQEAKILLTPYYITL